MKLWVEEIHEQAADLERQSQERDAAKADEVRKGFSLRFTKMEDRIRSILDTLPLDERDKPRHMEFFQLGLRAKYPTRGRGRAAAGEIGQALRALGWTRNRYWRGGAEQGFTTVWVPPVTEERAS